MDYMEVLVAAPYSGDTVIVDRVIHSESYLPKSSPQTPQDVPLELWDLSLQVSLDSLAKMLGARFLIPWSLARILAKISDIFAQILNKKATSTPASFVSCSSRYKLKKESAGSSKG